MNNNKYQKSAIRKTFVLAFLAVAFQTGLVSPLLAAQFNKSTDILIAQFDNRQDEDDIHSQAALGCILVHPDGIGINCFAVMGAYGSQDGPVNNSRSLFTMAFGAENSYWTDAHADRANSVILIKEKAKPVLLDGGKVWVQEAGQSDVTADWIAALLADGVPAATVKNNVMVVQHSQHNEDVTTASKLQYVKTKATFIPIDDGNIGWGQGTDRGPNTPSYRNTNTTYMNQAKSANNPNKIARSLWVEADRIIHTINPIENRGIAGGGVDFSDCVENYYILELNNALSVSEFWSRYVVNTPTNTGNLLEPEAATINAVPVSLKVLSLSPEALSFALPKAGTYSITVFNVAGAKVMNEISGFGNTGVNTIPMNGSVLGNQTYIINLQVGKKVSIQKMIPQAR